MAKQKYYVVWIGKKPGIYDSWAKCQEQVNGFPNAEYKSFTRKEDAERAFKDIEAYKSGLSPKKKTFYVVWEGFKPGVYDNWETAHQQLNGFTKPVFKAFGSEQLALEAFNSGPENYTGRSFKKTIDMTEEEKKIYGYPDPLSICVDAASNDKGTFEYRGVITESGTEIFHFGPQEGGSNNVGEFLALVHGLAYLKKNRSALKIYSDSKYALKWVKNKKANTKVTDTTTLQLVQRAEEWLNKNDFPNELIKWQTKFWGEIPADFGRK